MPSLFRAEHNELVLSSRRGQKYIITLTLTLTLTLTGLTHARQGECGRKGSFVIAYMNN